MKRDHREAHGVGLVLDLTQIGDGTTALSRRLDTGELDLAWPGLRFGERVEVEIEIARARDDLDILLAYTGELGGACDRCLKPFERALRGRVRAIGRKAEADHELAGQDGVVFHDGRFLDLTSEVREAVLIDIPIRNLCTEECQGLCSRCGKDLNLGPCGCSVAQADPRWGALRKLRGQV